MRGRMRAHLREQTAQAIGVTLQLPVSVSVLPDFYVFYTSAFVLPSNGSSRPALEGEVSVEMAVLLSLGIEPPELGPMPYMGQEEWGRLVWPQLSDVNEANPALTNAEGRVKIAIWTGADLIGRVLRILAIHVASGAQVWKTLTIDQAGKLTWLSEGSAPGSDMSSDFRQPETGGDRDHRAPYEKMDMGQRRRRLLR